MIKEEEIREAFQHVREEISFLKNELLVLKSDVSFIKDNLKNELKDLKLEMQHKLNVAIQNATHPKQMQQINQEFGRIKPYIERSIGNEGVATNKQTNKQTHLQHIFRPIEENLRGVEATRAALRKIFLVLTRQEFHIYSILYELESRLGSASYRELAQAAHLDETSIRVYVKKLIEKNVPIIKEKRNNKDVVLKISPEFKQLETLTNLIKLRASMEQG